MAGVSGTAGFAKPQSAPARHSVATALPPRGRAKQLCRPQHRVWKHRGALKLKTIKPRPMERAARRGAVGKDRSGGGDFDHREGEIDSNFAADPMTAQIMSAQQGGDSIRCRLAWAAVPTTRLFGSGRAELVWSLPTWCGSGAPAHSGRYDRQIHSGSSTRSLSAATLPPRPKQPGVAGGFCPCLDVPDRVRRALHRAAHGTLTSSNPGGSTVRGSRRGKVATHARQHGRQCGARSAAPVSIRRDGDAEAMQNRDVDGCSSTRRVAVYAANGVRRHDDPHAVRRDYASSSAGKSVARQSRDAAAAPRGWDLQQIYDKWSPAIARRCAGDVCGW